MPRLDPLDPDQAPSTSRTLLAGIIERNGDAGPMVRTMAYSPALLQGYLRSGSAARSARPPTPRPGVQPASLRPTSR
jgi:hypothetical protein